MVRWRGFMNRRRFLSAAASLAVLQGDTRRDLLLPSDNPDELGFRLMWYNPVAPVDHHKYRLAVGGLADQPQSLSLEQLRRLPLEKQSSRLKCVQCWSSRTDWAGVR